MRGVGDRLSAAARILARAGIESTRLDAAVLMAEAAGVSRAEVVTGSVTPTEEMLARFDSMVARRAAREPLAYIIGRQEFFSLDFEVTPDVLIPRPETETLVHEALETVGRKPIAPVLDIGTGSGAIAIAIAVNAPGAQVVALDISRAALEIAHRNAARHRVEGRVHFSLADVYKPLDGGEPLGHFDVIAANPPYVAAAEMPNLEAEIRSHEPRVALTDEGDGLEFYRRIAAGALAHLNKSGTVLVEMGAGRASAIEQIFTRSGLEVMSVISDLAGIPRVLKSRARP
jgi:release factor glutamine methyltransferase